MKFEGLFEYNIAGLFELNLLNELPVSKQKPFPVQMPKIKIKTAIFLKNTYNVDTDEKKFFVTATRLHQKKFPGKFGSRQTFLKLSFHHKAAIFLQF